MLSFTIDEALRRERGFNVFAPGFVSLTCLILTKSPSLSFIVRVCVCVCVFLFQLGVSMEVVSGVCVFEMV